MSENNLIEKFKKIRSKEKITLPSNCFLKNSIVLRNYQTVDTYQLLISNSFVSSLATGLGKTLLSIATFSYIKEKCPNSKMLVFAPRSALLQWKEEFKNFTNNIDVSVVNAKVLNRQKRMKIYEKFFASNDSSVIVLTYGILKQDNLELCNLAKEYREKNSSEESIVLVFDEASVFKSIKSITYKAVKNLSLNADRKFALSATCILNKLDEMYAIFDAIGINPWGSYSKFCTLYCEIEILKLRRGNRVVKIPKIIGYKNLNDFKEKIFPYFQARSKESVAKELPALITKKLSLDMTEKQNKKYKEIETGFLENPDGNIREIKNLLAKMTLCQQICNSPALLGHENIVSSKEEELFRLLDNELENEKIIIYTRFKSWIERIYKIFHKNVESENFKNLLKVTGDDSEEEIEKNKQLFLKSDNHNIIFITNAGSKALNLQSASTIIFLDTPWSYGEYIQLVGRAQRIGANRNNILVMHMVNSSIDESVLEHLAEKKELFNNIYGDQSPDTFIFKTEDQENDLKNIVNKICKKI